MKASNTPKSSRRDRITSTTLWLSSLHADKKDVRDFQGYNINLPTPYHWPTRSSSSARMLLWRA
ncbi:hypothetical protein EYF80_064168 [Liparis tanakae]|uniref:Uncharacterized protein n=1 Tax=Liparis tanakae TaxID=230148 RepID=A0A4Z2EBN6_9TELE|nr:hypothetical protein EYF80_064168 [Liparis tanakae]